MDDIQFEKVKNRIIADFTASVTPVNIPTAIIMGAQPGAGKSELETEAMTALELNAVVCNVDNIKEYYPGSDDIRRRSPELYDEIVTPYAHRWNLALRNYCISNKLNFILETTFSDGNSINQIIQKLKDNKYKVDLFILACPAELSRISIFERYEVMYNAGLPARRVNPDSHDERFRSIPEALRTVEKSSLYDTVSLFGRRITNLNMNDDYGIYAISKNQKSIYKDYCAEATQNLIGKVQELIKKKVEYTLYLMKHREATREEIEEFCSLFEIDGPEKNNTLRL